ncbi:MAG: bifunctional aspartate kinase/homoserine dehydrogenase I [Candidatus Kariarchaeaceae archaeon]
MGYDNKTNQNVVLVLSAIDEVTDKLIGLLDDAAARNETYLRNLDELKDVHLQLITSLSLEGSINAEVTRLIEDDFSDLANILKTIWISKSYSDGLFELVSGYGEIWSTRIMNSLLISTDLNPLWLDSRKIIVSDLMLTGPSIDWRASKAKLEQHLVESSEFDLLIVPGYVASTKEGLVTTLKRNGSDFTASIMAVLLKADQINIWTDVNGMYSADPRRVPDAQVLNTISYLEALELAYFGAEVLFPKSIAAAIENNIPIIIRNTFEPVSPGTKIHNFVDDGSRDTLVKGFATIDSIALINLEGSGMIGVPGIAQKLFSSLSEEKISVIMISQASSEYSICVVIAEHDGEKARLAVEKAFAMEIMQGHIQSVQLERNVGILAAIGDKMVHQPGIASIFFNALSRSRINVRMISQGSSERNISVILDNNDMTRGLRAVHSAFYLSHLTLSIGIIGIGLIGGTLLDLIEKQVAKLRNQSNIDLRINGLANSNHMLLKKQISPGSWKEEFENGKEKMELEAFTRYIHTDSLPHSVIIDCTSSQEIADMYEQWLEEGIHVITPNKKANANDWLKYETLQKYIHKGPSTNPLDKTTHYFYETTVGAGLPIISTLKDLIKTGDVVTEIEGILSGTLSFIFNILSETTPFSEIVKLAKEKGYTEPDPRDDLSGMDIARKLVILAREIGLKIDVDDVTIEPLLPEHLFDDPNVEEFLVNLTKYDSDMVQRISVAKENKQVLRYVGVININGECSISLKPYPMTHPFANLHGSENIILFKTKRYDTYPLIVQGPGAGAAVTSGGVFADLLRLADLLGSS